MARHNFKKLKIWQKGILIVKLVYEYMETLPEKEKWNLISQSIRSACSIPANIAEGSGRKGKKDYAHFLSISLSSAYELETHLLVCEMQKYGDQELLKNILIELVQEQMMLFSYRNKVEQSAS